MLSKNTMDENQPKQSQFIAH